MRILLLCLSVLIPFSGLTDPAIDLEAEARTLLATDQAFADLSAATSSRIAFSRYMAPDGILMPASSERAVEGYDQVMSLFGTEDNPARKLLWQPQFAEIASAGDMGWTWGTWQSQVDGQTITRGKYVNIWKKQPDGSWKVRVDVGNQQPAAAEQ